MLNVFMQLTVQELTHINELLALLKDPDEFTVVGRLHIRHLPFPQTVDVSLETLGLAAIQQSEKRLREQSFLAGLGVEWGKHAIEMSELDGSARPAPERHSSFKSIDIVIKQKSNCFFFTLLMMPTLPTKPRPTLL